MLIKILLTTSGELFSTKIDIIQLKNKYPLFFENYKNNIQSIDRWEVEEIIPDAESMIELIKKEEAVLLHFKDGTVTPIYNTELITFNGLESDGFSIESDFCFIYFIISIVGQQAGSLGIWSIENREWIFTHREDGLCIEAILYVRALDCFVGFAEWRQYTNPTIGNFFFLIDTQRKYSIVTLTEDEEFDWELANNELNQYFINDEDSVLGYDEQQAAIFISRGDKRLAYKLGNEVINSLPVTDND